MPYSISRKNRHQRQNREFHSTDMALAKALNRNQLMERALFDLIYNSNKSGILVALVSDSFFEPSRFVEIFRRIPADFLNNSKKIAKVVETVFDKITPLAVTDVAGSKTKKTASYSVIAAFPSNVSTPSSRTNTPHMKVIVRRGIVKAGQTPLVEEVVDNLTEKASMTVTSPVVKSSLTLLKWATSIIKTPFVALSKGLKVVKNLALNPYVELVLVGATLYGIYLISNSADTSKKSKIIQKSIQEILQQLAQNSNVLISENQHVLGELTHIQALVNEIIPHHHSQELLLELAKQIEIEKKTVETTHIELQRMNEKASTLLESQIDRERLVAELSMLSSEFTELQGSMARLTKEYEANVAEKDGMVNELAKMKSGKALGQNDIIADLTKQNGLLVQRIRVMESELASLRDLFASMSYVAASPETDLSPINSAIDTEAAQTTDDTIHIDCSTRASNAQKESNVPRQTLELQDIIPLVESSEGDMEFRNNDEDVMKATEKPSSVLSESEMMQAHPAEAGHVSSSASIQESEPLSAVTTGSDVSSNDWDMISDGDLDEKANEDVTSSSSST